MTKQAISSQSAVAEIDGSLSESVQRGEILAVEAIVVGDAALISTGWDYARFLQMLLNGGMLNDIRILSER